jgi:hypothetical protein
MIARLENLLVPGSGSRSWRLAAFVDSLLRIGAENAARFVPNRSKAAAFLPNVASHAQRKQA